MRENVIAMIVVVACAMAFVSPIQAQKKTEIGVKGGLGFANLTGDVSDNKSMLCFGGGGLFRFSPSPQFSIQPEVLLVLKGAKYEDGYDSEKVKLTYIEVPVLAMYRPPTGGKVSPSFFAGPAISLLISAKAGDEDIKDEMNSTDLGLVFGAGVDFETGAKGKISLDGRYTMGISNIVKDSSDNSVRNGVFFLGVNYIFPLGQ
jgi:hypothetical protein